MGAWDLKKKKERGKTGENHDTLDSSTDLSKKRVGEITVPPTELVSVDVEGDDGSDCLTREARSMRRFGTLMAPRTRSGSVGRSLVVRRGDGGGFPMKHAKDVVHTRGRIVEGHNKVGVVGWCWWKWLSGE